MFASCRQEIRRRKQHRGMPVVAAGMHHARVSGAILKSIFLPDGKRVHIRAQANRRQILFPVRVIQARHHPAGKHLIRNIRLFQTLANKRSRPRLFAGKFR